MASDILRTTATVSAPAEAVFAVLADPARHAAIDGTGWVRESLDGRVISETGQMFRMAMYHANHPDGRYEMANKVLVFDPPGAIAWEPGQQVPGGDDVEFGGWIWRYDLSPADDGRTHVTLTFDWSAVPQAIREEIGFPPFSVEHLENSLQHLADLVVQPGAVSSRP